MPTIAQAGVGDMEFVNWYGIFAPPRMPAAVIQLNRAVNNALDMRSAIDAVALRSVGGLLDDFRKSIVEDPRRRGQAVIGVIAPR